MFENGKFPTIEELLGTGENTSFRRQLTEKDLSGEETHFL